MNTIIDDINNVLAQWCKDVISQIKTNLDTTGTTATGKTKESLVYEVSDGSCVIYGRPYFKSVENGRPAGKVPYNFKDILYEWASAKGILSKFGDTVAKQKSTLWIIGQFIKNNGTKLYRNGGRRDIYTNVLESELPELEKKIGFKVEESILSNI